MILKVYEIAYGETSTATGSVAGNVVTYDITFSDQGIPGPVGPSGPQGIQGLPGDFVVNFRVVSAAETLVSKAKIAANTTAGALTLTLPANPTNGDVIDFYDYAETFDTNNLTIARNGHKIEGLDENLICNVKGAYFSLVYSGTTRGWQVLPSFGTSGGGGETVLTTQGDTLYRAVGVNARLPIGSTGQILKVSAQGLPTWANESGAVTSVNGQTGAVTIPTFSYGFGGSGLVPQASGGDSGEFLKGDATWALPTTSDVLGLSDALAAKQNTGDYVTPTRVEADWFDRGAGTDAATRSGNNGQKQFQIVLSNDSRLTNARAINWIIPSPTSPTNNTDTPALGSVSYDGNYLYILVLAPGGQSKRWGRVPMPLNW